uniref:Uncharacterized protein n=1 Tax=Oryza punctata TaxID=4537 RepID=A0A0E0LK99_ORYPU
MPPPEERRKPSPVESRERTQLFFQRLGVGVPLPVPTELPAAYSALVRGVLSSAAVSAPASPAPPRVSCTLSVSPAAVVSPSSSSSLIPYQEGALLDPL